jgi:chemosensory pili system protein ChpA (sensor histidine kinase/response regulator)
MPQMDVALFDTFLQAVRALLDAFVHGDETPPDYSPLGDEFDRLTGVVESGAHAARPAFDFPAEDGLEAAVAPPDFAEAAEDTVAAMRRPTTPSSVLERLPQAAKPATKPAPAAPCAPETAADAGRSPRFADLPMFDAEIAEIFFGEAEELLDAIDAALDAWSAERDRVDLVMALQRHLHTLKGGARMAGATPMGDLSHALESVLIEAVDGRVAATEALFGLLHRAVDRLRRMLEQGIADRPVADAADLIAALARSAGGGAAQDGGLKTASSLRPAEMGSSGRSENNPKDSGSENPLALTDGYVERRESLRAQPELVKVRAELLESALNHAGEVSIYRTRLEQQLGSMTFNLAELDRTVVRLRGQLRQLEIETETEIVSRFERGGGNAGADGFDPLELDRYSQVQQLSRALAESMDDLVSIQRLLASQAHESETMLLQQSRVTTDMQDSLMRTRMVPLSRYAQRLRRIVRQTADEVGKRAELTLVGAEGELDRHVLERVMAPLEHVLRNAVIHGVEAPEARRTAGKPELGDITIGVHRESSEVVITVLDDGRGLDLAAILRKAESLGLVGTQSALDETEIMQLILTPGFSTADVITQSAGRGVGMDVVANEIKQLVGTLAIDSVAGQGAKFTIRLPFTLAITQALIVNVADAPYAIPLPSIEGIARVPRRELEQYLKVGSPAYAYGGHEYRLQHLSALLGLDTPPISEGVAKVPLLLAHSGDRLTALITEGMQGSREIVVKSGGPQVSSIRGLSGATILGDGGILPILDVAALMRAADPGIGEGRQRAAGSGDPRPLALVVDDSITVRRVTARLLERHGMQVTAAKDGVDALAVLQESIPDVILLDVEMPRMDGYELVKHLRNDARLNAIPVIMITSRTGEKHRLRAAELGIEHYLGKPYREHELIAQIQARIGTLDHKELHA